MNGIVIRVGTFFMVICLIGIFSMLNVKPPKKQTLHVRMKLIQVVYPKIMTAGTVRTPPRIKNAPGIELMVAA